MKILVVTFLSLILTFSLFSQDPEVVELFYAGNDAYRTMKLHLKTTTNMSKLLN